MEIASANSRAPAVLFRRHGRCKDVDAIPRSHLLTNFANLRDKRKGRFAVKPQTTYFNIAILNPFQVVIKDPGHGKPADWWSLGIFFFDLVTGRSPFSSNRGKKVVKENILKGKFNIPPYITQDAQDLLRYVSHVIASRLNLASLYFILEFSLVIKLSPNGDRRYLRHRFKLKLKGPFVLDGKKTLHSYACSGINALCSVGIKRGSERERQRGREKEKEKERISNKRGGRDRTKK